jgi:hypothetical protein
VEPELVGHHVFDAVPFEGVQLDAGSTHAPRLGHVAGLAVQLEQRDVHLGGNGVKICIYIFEKKCIEVKKYKNIFFPQLQPLAQLDQQPADSWRPSGSRSSRRAAAGSWKSRVAPAGTPGSPGTGCEVLGVLPKKEIKSIKIKKKNNKNSIKNQLKLKK